MDRVHAGLRALALVSVCIFVSPALASEILDVRVGVHPGATRIVLDTVDEISFTAFTESNGAVLRVTLPESIVRTESAKIVEQGIIRDYAFRGEGAALALVVEGREPMRIERSFRLAADGQGGHRIVIDVSRADFDASMGAQVAQADRTPRPVRRGAAFASPENLTVDTWLASQRRMAPGNSPVARPTTSGHQPLPTLAEMPKSDWKPSPGSPTPSRHSPKPVVREGYKSVPGQGSESVTNESRNRFYVGGSFGRSWIGSNVEETSGTLETEDFGFKAFGGMNVSPYFALEAFYADLGEASLKVAVGDTAKIDGTVYQFTTSGDFTASVTSIGIAGTFGLPEDRTFRPFLKAGFHRWSETDEVTDSSLGTISVSEGGFGPIFGIGAQLRVLRDIKLRAEYESFGGGFGTDANYIQYLSAGAQYGF